eukprot:857417-Pyramimonas_sp.AAC.1
MRMSAALASVDQETGVPQQRVITAAVNKASEMTQSILPWISLVLAIRTSLFPIEAQEANILSRVWQRPYGPLSRQSGESMVSYISRGKRRWKLVS